MDMEEAFQLLMKARNGVFEDNIPVRTKASPIDPSISCFYVIATGTNSREFQKLTLQSGGDKSGKGSGEDGKWEEQSYKGCNLEIMDETWWYMCEKQVEEEQYGNVGLNRGRIEEVDVNLLGDNLKTDEDTMDSTIEKPNARKRKCCQIETESHSYKSCLSSDSFNTTDSKGRLISVKYQSFHGRNVEFWWSPHHDFNVGVLARSMEKTTRKQKDVFEPSFCRESRKHGYAGKIFALITRSELVDEKRSKDLSNHEVRSLLCPGVPSLVKFWLEDSNISKQLYEEECCLSQVDLKMKKTGIDTDLILSSVNFHKVSSFMRFAPGFEDFTGLFDDELIQPVTPISQDSEVSCYEEVINLLATRSFQFDKGKFDSERKTFAEFSSHLEQNLSSQLERTYKALL